MTEPIVAEKVTPAVTPVVEKGGRDLLREAMPKIDYSEKFDEEVKPVEEAKPKEEVRPEEKKPEEKKVDPKEKLLEQALLRQRIAEVEAERAKAERDLLFRQQLQQAQLAQQVSAPQSNEPTKEQLIQMYQDDPFAVIEMISKRVADETKKKTIAEMNQQDQQQQVVQEFQSKQQRFAENAQKIVQENKELLDPEHPLTKQLAAIQAEFPLLLADPDGPIKGLNLAKQRLELESLKSKQVITPAVEEGKATEPARETVRVASMVTGPSRGVPPSPSVKLTPEEKMAAQKMRLTEEQFSAFKERSPKYFQKEQAPRRRVS